MDAARMFQIAIERCGVPPKAVAMEINCSVDAIYKAAKGKRRIPLNARQKLSEMGLEFGIANALAGTGYELIFSYDERDRHIQSLIQRLMKEDFEADQALKSVVWELLDKTTPEDLTPDDVEVLRQLALEIFDRIRCELNFLMELNSTYRLSLEKLIRTKEKQSISRQAQCSVHDLNLY